MYELDLYMFLLRLLSKSGKSIKLKELDIIIFERNSRMFAYQLRGRVIFTGSGKLISTPKHSWGAQTKEPIEPLQILQTVHPFVCFHAFFDHPRNLLVVA